MGGKQDLDTGISKILVFCPILLFRVNMYWASTTPYTRKNTLASATLFVLAMTTSSIDGTLTLFLTMKKKMTLMDMQDMQVLCASCRETQEAPRIWYFNRKWNLKSEKEILTL